VIHDGPQLRLPHFWGSNSYFTTPIDFFRTDCCENEFAACRFGQAAMVSRYCCPEFRSRFYLSGRGLAAAAPRRRGRLYGVFLVLSPHGRAGAQHLSPAGIRNADFLAHLFPVSLDVGVFFFRNTPGHSSRPWSTPLAAIKSRSDFFKSSFHAKIVTSPSAGNSFAVKDVDFRPRETARPLCSSPLLAADARADYASRLP